jgi:hypothetical protein
VILVAAEEQDSRAAEVHHGGQEVGQPETDVFLRIHHADLAQDRANVDHHVEVQVDAGDGGRGINNHAVAVLEGLDVGDFFAVLLGDQGRDIGPDSVSIEFQAKRGEAYLKPPVPTPMISKPMEKQAMAPLGLAITGGNAETIRMV